MNNWQPIETAPRDGTEFLGFSYSESYHVVSYGYTHDGNLIIGLMVMFI